jgi:predicted PurR-regulated permease PerM
MNASLERREADNGMGAAQATGWLRDHSSRIMTAGIILALLHLGRSVPIPLALAIMLSWLVAPLFRALRRLRIGRASSVLVALAALTVLCVGIAAALGTQVLHTAESLPQYESNVQRKLELTSLIEASEKVCETESRKSPATTWLRRKTG